MLVNAVPNGQVGQLFIGAATKELDSIQIYSWNAK